jgi:hypothetical protein
MPSLTGTRGQGTTLGQGETERKLRVVASFGPGEAPVKTELNKRKRKKR